MGRRLSTRENLDELLRADGATPALCSLVEAVRAGTASGESAWEFALHLHRLLEGGLRPTILRLLIDGGYLEQRLETTGENAKKRTFRPVKHLSLEDRCCVLLTARGVTFVRSILQEAPKGDLANGAVVGVAAVRPRWSAGPGALWLGKRVVRRVAKNARNLRQVLAALEEEHWPADGIDNPLGPTKKVSDVQRLTETVEELNQHQGQARIEFSLDDSKTRVSWRIP